MPGTKLTETMSITFFETFPNVEKSMKIPLVQICASFIGGASTEIALSNVEDLMHLSTRASGIGGLGLRLVIVFVFSTLLSGATAAQLPKAPPTGTPIEFRYNGEIIRSFEPSAIEPVDDLGKVLLVANDKSITLDGTSTTLVLAHENGTIIKTLSIPGVEDDQKWEAMAKDGDDFYLLSAHDVATHNKFLRFSLNSSNNEITGLIETFDISESLIAKGLLNDKKWPQDMVKLEGLAIRKTSKTKELIFGFRKPFSDGNLVQTYAAKIPTCSNSPCTLSLRRFFKFDVGYPAGKSVPFEISSLEYSDKLNGFFVLTSAEGTELNGNSIWFIGDDEIERSGKLVSKDGFVLIPPAYFVTHPSVEFASGLKAEGLCIVKRNNKDRLVIVFDNDRRAPGFSGTLLSVAHQVQRGAIHDPDRPPQRANFPKFLRGLEGKVPSNGQTTSLNGKSALNFDS
jgi:hypothetical protein